MTALLAYALNVCMRSKCRGPDRWNVESFLSCDICSVLGVNLKMINETQCVKQHPEQMH